MRGVAWREFGDDCYGSEVVHLSIGTSGVGKDSEASEARCVHVSMPYWIHNEESKSVTVNLRPCCISHGLCDVPL